MHKTKKLTLIFFSIFSFLLLFFFIDFTTTYASEIDNTITKKEDCYQLANKVLDLVLTKNILNEKEATMFASAIFELENRIDCLNIVKNNIIPIKSSEQLSSIKQPFIFIYNYGVALPFTNLKRNYYNIIPTVQKLSIKNDTTISDRLITIKPIAGLTSVLPRTLKLLSISTNLTLVIPENMHNAKLKNDLINFIKKLEKDKHLNICYITDDHYINIPRINITSFHSSNLISCPAKHIEKSFNILTVNYSSTYIRGQNNVILLHIYDDDSVNPELQNNPRIINTNEADYIATKVKNQTLTIDDIKDLLKKLLNSYYITEEDLCFYEDIKQNKENFITLTVHKKTANTTCAEQAMNFINKEFQTIKNIVLWINKEILKK